MLMRGLEDSSFVMLYSFLVSIETAVFVYSWDRKVAGRSSVQTSLPPTDGQSVRRGPVKSGFRQDGDRLRGDNRLWQHSS
ncbi:hypothetical protein Q5P01_004467 [Channa striata]|uniref:Uncharacterized protein n=1 Tax=Channa striata TaxID=64152 RepID=A0AA88TAF9_CHASR|nr:hypothetical protein Q5P01_004467 [Channa striata]